MRKIVSAALFLVNSFFIYSPHLLLNEVADFFYLVNFYFVWFLFQY